MSDKQRFRLGDYLNQVPQYYHATFGYIAHKVNQQHKKIPLILLKDIYLVDENDKKIRLSKKADFKDNKGNHIVADHLWVKLTKPWFELPDELLYGDEVYFRASVETYNIVRKDVLDQRQAIWDKAKKKSDQIYKRWAKYTEDHYRKNFSLSLNKMKEKQKKIMEQAKEDQAQLSLVDYGLNHIDKIKVVRSKRALYGVEREPYNYQQYKKQGYKYSSYLAAKSMNYAKRKAPRQQL